MSSPEQGEADVQRFPRIKSAVLSGLVAVGTCGVALSVAAPGSGVSFLSQILPATHDKVVVEAGSPVTHTQLNSPSDQIAADHMPVEPQSDDSAPGASGEEREDGAAAKPKTQEVAQVPPVTPAPPKETPTPSTTPTPTPPATPEQQETPKPPAPPAPKPEKKPQPETKPAPKPETKPKPDAEPAPAPAPDAPHNTAPAPGGKPSPGNTGPRTTSLKKSGTITVTKPGTVIENVDVSGQIIIKASNVTIRNVRVRSNTTARAIDVTKGHGKVLIENSEIRAGVGGAEADAAIGGIGDYSGKHGTSAGSNVTVRGCEIYSTTDGVKIASYSLYEGNYIYANKKSGSKVHLDGMQASARNNWEVRNNHIHLPGKGANASIFVEAYTAGKNKRSSNGNIHHNWFDGGYYMIHSEDGKKQAGQFLYNMRVADNIFTRRYKYGAAHLDGPGWSGNIGKWADNGKPVKKGNL